LREIKKCAMSHLCDDTHPGLSHFLGSKHRSHSPSAGESMECAWEGSTECWSIGMLDYSGSSIVLDMI
jgi:hypothetical protein